MIYTYKAIRTALVHSIGENGESYERPATGTINTSKLSDDYEVESRNARVFSDDVLVVFSMSQLRKLFKFKLIFTVVFGFLIFNIMLFVLREIATQCISMTRYPTIVELLKIGLWFVVTLLYLPQAVNPTLNGQNGIWINLRTGSSNLNGGCVIL